MAVASPVTRPPVRALTVGVAEAHPLPDGALEHSASLLRRAAAALRAAGWEVQSERLSTRPVLADLARWPVEEIEAYAARLQDALGEDGVICSIGPAPPGTPPERAEAMSGFLAGRPALFGSVMVASPGADVDAEAARAAAHAMARLARETEQGLGNFNFAALACVGPGAPFFPAAYHAGPASLSIALQGAGLVAQALAAKPALKDVAGLVAAVVAERAGPAVELARAQATALGLRFGGIDLSPAPLGADSIGAVFEAAGGGPVGAPGTLALAAAITAGLRATALPACGYCGLMLPVMEDDVLAQRWAEGRYGVDQLLAYSAVCGTGLDTVPLPGGTSTEDLAAVIADMASLALRQRKPLSARLLLVPGKGPGERTEFSSPHLVNTLVQPLAGLPRGPRRN